MSRALVADGGLVNGAPAGGAPLADDVVAVHPERTGHPLTVRWYVAGTSVSDTAVAEEPALTDLIGTGVLSAVDVVAGRITTTLAAGQTWAGAGAAVRAGVQAAVRASVRASASPGARRRPAAPADADAALHGLATRVLQADVGPYAAGHGGGIELLGVSGGVVDVRMVGACHGCPAAGWTVQGRLERLLRAEAPWLVEVRIVDRSPRLHRQRLM